MRYENKKHLRNKQLMIELLNRVRENQEWTIDELLENLDLSKSDYANLMYKVYMSPKRLYTLYNRMREFLENEQ